jgi:hypothetical protein
MCEVGEGREGRNGILRSEKKEGKRIGEVKVGMGLGQASERKNLGKRSVQQVDRQGK